MADSSAKSKVYITNLNSFSTLIDRLCIENVKLSHFEYLLEEYESNSSASALHSPESLRLKISSQVELIAAIKEELVNLLSQLLSAGLYNYYDESRTFREPK